ncbi:2'-5' RNA ligase family protein [Chloroflexota bacterium]
MHGLVSLLPSPYYQKVENIWDELEEDFGLSGIRVTPYPHFSWNIAKEYNIDQLKYTLQTFIDSTPPFKVHTTGIGMFTGANPVVFIPVVKDEYLLNLHNTIWEQVQPMSKGLSPYYCPGAWMPHISLAYEGIDSSKIQSLINKLAFISYNWEMVVDNISFIYEPDGQIGSLKFQIDLNRQQKTGVNK